jgi:phage protein U
MAVIGSFGDIVFSVSDKKINTIKDASWSSSARYAEHARHTRDPLVEFLGNDNDKFSFEMVFSAFLGVNPALEIAKALNMERSGTAARLIIGTKAYGKNKWVITGTTLALREIDDKGVALVASMTVSLLAYPSR